MGFFGRFFEEAGSGRVSNVREKSLEGGQVSKGRTLASLRVSI